MVKYILFLFNYISGETVVIKKLFIGLFIVLSPNIVNAFVDDLSDGLINKFSNEFDNLEARDFWVGSEFSFNAIKFANGYGNNRARSSN